jgi:hypothetical protein
MRCFASRSVVFLLAVMLGAALMPVASAGRGGTSPLVPPQSHAFGKSFEDWNVLYADWHLGGTSSDTVGKVRFLPTGPASEPVIGEDGTFIFTDEFRVRLRPGTPFVAPPFFVAGERYDNGAEDTPQDVIDLGLLDTATILFTLDGEVLMDGTGTELESFMFGPTYFDEPITIDPPQPRGPGLNAVASLFVQGIGAVFHPLPVGEHTLQGVVRSAVLNIEFHFTWHITVSTR